MSKFTPGPWNIGTKNGARVWSENGETLIADVDASESLRKEIKKANARLIAAAPDLLEALKMAVSALERSDYIQMDGDSFDVVDVARAVIAKATGSTK